MESFEPLARKPLAQASIPSFATTRNNLPLDLFANDNARQFNFTLAPLPVSLPSVEPFSFFPSASAFETAPSFASFKASLSKSKLENVAGVTQTPNIGNLKTHPFSYISNMFPEIIAHRGSIFVPCDTKTEFTLRSEGLSKYMLKMGPISTIIEIPPVENASNTVQNICDQTRYYYQNPDKLKTDLLRFTNEKIRKQYFLDFFSKSFYIKKATVMGANTLSADSTAIFSDGKSTVAFSKNSDTDGELRDVMATSWGQKFDKLILDKKIRHITSSIESARHGSNVRFRMYVPSHTISAVDKKFKFKDTWLESNVNFSNNMLYLREYPHVTDFNYKHFFVLADGRICYNGSDRFEDVGLKRGTWYPLADKLISYNLARVLSQGFENLLYGYKPDCSPINRPQNLKEFEI